MAHSLTPAAATIASITVRPNHRKVCAPSQVNDWSPSLVRDNNLVICRRDITLGLGFAGALLGLSIGEQEASAAARRPPPPPPPPGEKKDPNVSGVLAKVLASKKRKEAMKEEIARLRGKGKVIVNE